MKKSKIKIAVIVATRPDVIKMAPVVKQLSKCRHFSLSVISVAQHREMLDQMLDIFSIPVDFDLDVMRKKQDLADITVRVTKKLFPVIKRVKPDMLLVQGDTSAAFVSSLAAFYCKVPVGHIEAGLRTYDKYNPYPEEINRKLISCLSDIYFAPTKTARDNLIKEGFNKSTVYVTGNTGIDALLMTVGKRRNPGRAGSRKEKTVLVTAHRRENWGSPIQNICYALKKIVSVYPDVRIIYPVHLNPNIQRPVHSILGKVPRIMLVPPLGYQKFAQYMKESHLILTDSGGLQEEAPALGKPVLVLRKVTERPEGIKAGTAKIVGVQKDKIFSQVSELLTDRRKYDKMARAINPYGDGKAAERISGILLYHFKFNKKPPAEFKWKKR